MESTMMTIWMLVVAMVIDFKNTQGASLPSSNINASSAINSSVLPLTGSPTTSQVHSIVYNKGCPTIKEVTITVMHSPPYVMYDSNGDLNGKEREIRGVLVDFFLSNIKKCYHECPPFDVKWKVRIV
jgi:hypothetical protein